MFAEEDLLPISALQHLIFCERQCALIHIEGQWAENRLTVEGRHLHERADGGEAETRGAVRTARAVPLRSLRLGLIGKADVVEFHEANAPGAAPRVFPVEYKRGRPKSHRADEVQLCAQALCLEEMLGTSISGGALFYGVTRRRKDVMFDRTLRSLTEDTTSRLHVLIRGGVTPKAKREPKCDNCSLLDICLPGTIGLRRSAAAYFEQSLSQSLHASLPAAEDE